MRSAPPGTSATCTSGYARRAAPPSSRAVPMRRKSTRSTISHNYRQGFALEFALVGTRNSTPVARRAQCDCLPRAARRAGTAATQPCARDCGRHCAGARVRHRNRRTGCHVRLPWRPCASRPASRQHAKRPRHPHHALAAPSHEVPIMALDGALWLRISAAAYNDISDYDGLAEQVIAAARQRIRLDARAPRLNAGRTPTVTVQGKVHRRPTARPARRNAGRGRKRGPVVSRRIAHPVDETPTLLQVS